MLNNAIARAALFAIAIGSLPCAAFASSLITEANLDAFAPKGAAEIRKAIVQNWRLAESAGINTELRTLHFIATLATETGGFRRLDENLNYSAQQLRLIFPSRVTPSQAQQLANTPKPAKFKAIALHVYGGRLGNARPPSEDGWNYRGSGYIQLTGRENFQKMGQLINRNLVDNPDSVRDMKIGFEVAVEYWRTRNVNFAADRNDLNKVRFLVNGGDNGLTAFRIWFAHAKKVLLSESGAGDISAIEEAAQEEDDAIAEQLVSLGLLAPPDAAASFDELENAYTEAIGDFQLSRQLSVTGVIDDDTLYAITDPLGRFSN